MKNLSLGIRIAILTTILILLTSIPLIFLTYQRTFRDLQGSVADRLRAVAATAAMQIDGDTHEMIYKLTKSPQTSERSLTFFKALEAVAKRNEPVDDNFDKIASQIFGSNLPPGISAFKKLRAFLSSVYDANRLNTDLYTFRRDDFDKTTLRFVGMAKGGVYFNHSYRPRPHSVPLIEKTFSDGTPTQTQIYEDEHGAWISAYAPIRTSSGSIVGILEVDEKLPFFYEELRMRLFWLFLTSVLVLSFGIFASWLFSRRIVRQLVYLRDRAEQASLGQMDLPIAVDSKDEVGQLAESIERMRESLRLAKELLSDQDDA